jgi:hypothetical protein
MGLGEIVGGVAFVGVAVLIGLALRDENAPATLTGADVTLADTSPTSPASSTAPAAATVPSTRPAATTTQPAASPSTTTTTSPPSTSAAPTTVPATSPSAVPAEISVRVLNGGAGPGAAGRMTDALRFAGFDAAGPADASVAVGATTVLYAPGQQAAAEQVNTVVRASPVGVIAVTEADGNWRDHGAGMDVLIVLGPVSG